MQEENPDLFYGAPWSHGTLGFLVSAEIRIIPAYKFVKIEYFPVHNFDEIVKVFGEKILEKPGHEFVECLMYSENKAVVMTANQTTSAEPDKVREII